MAKKTFSFRIDEDNRVFLDQLNKHGDNRSRLINHAIRQFKYNMSTAAKLAYIFLPGTLFDNDDRI